MIPLKRLRWYRRWCRECGRTLDGDAALFLQATGPPFARGVRASHNPAR